MYIHPLDALRLQSSPTGSPGCPVALPGPAGSTLTPEGYRPTLISTPCWTRCFRSTVLFLIFPTVCSVWYPKKVRPEKCASQKGTLIVKKEKESQIYLLFSFEYKPLGRGENNQLQVHQDMKIYIYNIYKMSLFTPLCTLFTRRPGSEGIEDEALLHHVSETFSLCKKNKQKKWYQTRKRSVQGGPKMSRQTASIPDPTVK